MQHALFRSLLVVTASLSLAAATALPASAGDNLTAQLPAAATLIAKGVAVEVDAVYSCSSGWVGNGEVEIRQSTKQGFAHGFSNNPALTCNGSSHTAQLLVRSDGIAFRKGVAFVNLGGFFACNSADFSMCESVDFLPAEIRIK